MALPKIDMPIFEMELPSTGEKVKYRPFTVKEEKILLVAQEAKDPAQELLAAKQVVNNCLFEKDVTDLAMFDLEYIMIHLRSKSVDNSISFNIKDPDTDETVTLNIDLDHMSIKHDPNHTNQVKISDTYTLFLKYPTIDEFVTIVEGDPNDPLINYFILISCLEKVASEDEVFEISNYSRQEIDDFMENLPGSCVNQIQQFFETMPRVRHELKYTNKEGTEKTFVIEGMRTFFI